MTYSIRIKQSAARALSHIGADDRVRIIEAIDRLADNPFAGSLLKGELYGLRRIRVGDFRVVYEVQEHELVVLVLRIGNRRDIYR